MLYRTSDAEEMKSIINSTRNMQQENPMRQYDHTVEKENSQYRTTFIQVRFINFIPMQFHIMQFLSPNVFPLLLHGT